MPTGYTSNISKGISFRQFILQCARAFGACVTMRDDTWDTSIPDEFKPSEYCKEALEKAQAELTVWKAITIDEAKTRNMKEYDSKFASYNEMIKEKQGLRVRYDIMLQQVNNWEPPTPDHQDLKRFMKTQICQSIDADCDTRYYTKPEYNVDAAAWLQKKINKCIFDIAYYQKQWDEEKERCAKRTAWIQALKKSLPE